MNPLTGVGGMGIGGTLTPDLTIPVAEIFGPTLQGEGALAGKPTYFLRVGGCDFRCEWCDSGHAVNPREVRELPRLTEQQIRWALEKQTFEHPGPAWLTISGGNPGLYDLQQVVAWWQGFAHPSGWLRRVAVETQGSRWQPWFGKVNLLTVSPKPPSSGMENKLFSSFMDFVGGAEEQAAQDDRLYNQNFATNEWQMVFKVVVFDEDDYLFARDLHIRYPLIPFYLSCGTAMGGLSGKWYPKTEVLAEADFNEHGHDNFHSVRLHPDLADQWTPQTYVDAKASLLRRYRWLAERMMGDEVMADVAGFPQLHALTWGIDTKGV